MNNIWGSVKIFGDQIKILVLVLAFASLAFGQTSSGRISGNVTDGSGAAVPNASVTVTDPSTNFSRTVTTDESGFYTVTNLPVGSYSVQAEMQNFKKAFRTNNVVSADSRLTVDITLEVGEFSEVVVVQQTSGETVNTTSGEVAKVIDSQQVANLALNGRNYYQLLSVIPGAVITTDDQIDTNLATNTININGSRGVANNLTVDGGNNLNAGSNASQINKMLISTPSQNCHFFMGEIVTCLKLAAPLHFISYLPRWGKLCPNYHGTQSTDDDRHPSSVYAGFCDDPCGSDCHPDCGAGGITHLI